MIDRLCALLFVLVALAVTAFTIYSFAHGYMELTVFIIALSGSLFALLIGVLAARKIQ